MINLTENAATHISNYLKNRGKGQGIRVGVKTSGCSGLSEKGTCSDQFLVWVWFSSLVTGVNPASITALFRLFACLFYSGS